MENGYGLTKWAPTSPCVREPSNTALNTNDEQMLSHFSIAFRATSATVPDFLRSAQSSVNEICPHV